MLLMKKNIIILTKSIKHGGFCVAGIDAENGQWIRLVSRDEETEGAVPKYMLQYSDGKDLAVYDIISVELIRAVPTVVQPENWLYDENYSWKKIGFSNLESVIKLHGFDTPEYVFENTEVSLPENWAFDGKSSLLLLKIPISYILVKTFDNGDKKVSLNFEYNKNKYQYMSISQKEIRDRFKIDGRHSTGSEYIVFSLTDKYYVNGKYYKVIAQILE